MELFCQSFLLIFCLKNSSDKRRNTKPNFAMFCLCQMVTTDACNIFLSTFFFIIYLLYLVPGDPINLNNYKQRDSQMKEGEIKNLKMKIKQLEIQLSNTKQEKDDKFKTMKKVIDCKDTEIQFQVSC